MRGTVHRTYLYSVKTKKFFLVLTLYKRPVCCADTQLAELCFTTFEFWEPGAGPERGAIYGIEQDNAGTDLG